MATDDERREIIERLRGYKERRTATGFDCVNDLWDLMHVLGRSCGECEDPWSCIDTLADLIEPTSIDRDALLGLADEMEGLCGPWSDCGKHYAPIIRKALGVENG